LIARTKRIAKGSNDLHAISKLPCLCRSCGRTHMTRATGVGRREHYTIAEIRKTPIAMRWYRPLQSAALRQQQQACRFKTLWPVVLTTFGRTITMPPRLKSKIRVTLQRRESD